MYAISTNDNTDLTEQSSLDDLDLWDAVNDNFVLEVQSGLEHGSPPAPWAKGPRCAA